MSEKNEKSESVIKRKVKKKKETFQKFLIQKNNEGYLTCSFTRFPSTFIVLFLNQKKKIEKDVLIIIPKLCTQNLKPL